MEERKLPNNIKQIGERDQQPRIYLEDYVYTFICRKQPEDNVQVGILLGHSEVVEEVSCRFLDGAILVDELVNSEGGIEFSEAAWEVIHRQIETYFPESAICGWFIKEAQTRDTDLVLLKQIHRSTFTDGESLMLVCQSEEQTFYNSNVDGIDKVAGYYIYYERNESMQNYMIQLATKSIKRGMSDNAIHSFRNIMKEHDEKRRRSNLRMIQRVGAGTAAAIIFLGICAAMGRVSTQIQIGGEEPSIIWLEKSKTQEESARQAAASVEESLEQMPETVGTVPSSEVVADGAFDMSEQAQIDEAQVTQTMEAQPSDEAAQEAGANLVGSGSYIVLPGDTLVQISLNFYGTTDRIEDICEFNGINNANEIYVGQKLLMP